MLGAAASFSERLPVLSVGSHEGYTRYEGVAALEEATSPDLQE
jgi:hypothetical protein